MSTTYFVVAIFNAIAAGLLCAVDALKMKNEK